MPALLLLLLILAIVLLFWITANVIGVLITLFIAGLIGAIAEALVPGRVPFGWLGAILAGLIGSWIGTSLLSRFGLPSGPVIAGIPIIGALVGAVILVFIAKLLLGPSHARPRV